MHCPDGSRRHQRLCRDATRFFIKECIALRIEAPPYILQRHEAAYGCGCDDDRLHTEIAFHHVPQLCRHLLERPIGVRGAAA